MSQRGQFEICFGMADKTLILSSQQYFTETNWKRQKPCALCFMATFRKEHAVCGGQEQKSIQDLFLNAKI